MDAIEQIKQFNEFIRLNYHSKLLENVNKGEYYLILDFKELIKFNPDLAEKLLEEPEELIKAAEMSIQDFDLPKKVKDFNIRFSNLSESQFIMIRYIRSKHIGKFLSTEGIVRQKSDVRPQVTIAKFECPSCGNTISVPQLDTKFREPSSCGCGRKGKFKLLSKELVDVQRIVLEEASEDMDGGEQPKRMNIFLRKDLVSPLSDKKTNPGSKIKINGILKEIPIMAKDGSGLSTTFDLMIESNYVEAVEEDFGEVLITPEDEEKIKDIGADPKGLQKMIESLAPSIYGYEKVKEAILLQLVGGCHKRRKDGSRTRGDMHVLLIGDPGAGKSQLLKRAQEVAPKSRYVSGKGASGAGLTAAVVKDEFLRGWALEAGALVLAHRGFCMIDELDKMTNEDRSAMHEALEQQTISISKANIHATLRCETTVLAAANPKFGRFDPYEIIAKQINLPPALISRFDLIFPIKDMPDEHKDRKLANFILHLHKDSTKEKVEVETELLRKFISYTRRRCNPLLTDEAMEEIKNYYVSMRNSGTEEGIIKSVPITPRQLEALIRLSEAHAKIRLSEEVSKKDAKAAIDLLNYCLMQIGLDKETGRIDIDRISSGITASQRNKIGVVKEIINVLENKIGKTIPIDDIIKEAEARDIEPDKIDEIIEKLKRSGDLFEPRKGFIQRI